MFALFSRILKLSGRYKGRIQGAFVCAFLESILSKMPIFLAFVILSGFAAGTLTSQTCLYVGLGLAAAVLVQMLVHYLSDSLQSAAGYLMFADKRRAGRPSAETSNGILHFWQHRKDQLGS